MVSRQSSHSMTSCPQQIAVPFAVCQAVCIFGGFGEIVFTSRHKQARWFPQHQNISCNATQFNVQLEYLMFCKDVCTLYHSTLRQAISRNATLFVCVLYHSIWRWTISRNATPFVCSCTIRHYAEPFHATLHCLYVRCSIQNYAELFYATLHHLCIRYATRHDPEPFDATLYRLCTVLQMSA